MLEKIKLNLFKLKSKNDLESVRDIVKKIVIDYYPNSKIVDYTFTKNNQNL